MLKTLAFSVRNDNGEAERETSHDCIDDSLVLETETSLDCTGDGLVLCSKNNENSEHKDVDVVASVSSSEEDLSQCLEEMRKLGSLHEKLKAIRLHVLASEQWNSSRLKLCHRYA